VKSFQDLKLPSALSKALEQMEFLVPTPIQAEAIPVALTQQDLLASAQTGTGKTAAFSIPLIVSLLKNPQQKALILVPTRELASQVSEVFSDLTQFLPELKPNVLIGGVPFQRQKKIFKKNYRVLVATPGRLVDHLKQRSLNLNQFSLLVLDEADRMLDIGFAPQLNEIFNYLPKVRQTLMFSATFPPAIQKFAEKYLTKPAKVAIGPTSQVKTEIEQKVIELEPQQKNDTLLDALNEREGSVLIFARTQSRTDRLSRYLESYGVSVTRIHGGRTQGQRNRALSGFRSGEYRVLVATDIAARGIDIDHVAHVINYDLPQVAEDYVHRVGRTGRAGRTGCALSLVTREDRLIWKNILRLSSKNDSGEIQMENRSGNQNQDSNHPSRPKPKTTPKPNPFRRQPRSLNKSGKPSRNRFPKPTGASIIR
jgi:superfamily II DNA/RNA helicase